MKRLVFILFSLFLLAPSDVFAVSCGDSCSDYGSCQLVAEECTSQITRLQSQANTLSNQIAQFDAQIKLMTIKIKQTEDKISLLTGRIDQLQISLEALTKAFTSRAVETYKLSRSGSGIIYFLTSPDLKEAVSRFHYLQMIQEADGSLLEKLTNAQTDYKTEKTSQEELQAQLDTQKAKLNSQKTAKASLLTATKNDEKRYQQLLSQAKARLAAFSSFAARQGGATILSNQTKCDGWGCYYSQRDSLWGNVFLGGTSYQMKDSGCFITSVAMLASHFRKDIKPDDIAQLPATVTSAGDLKWSFNVNGVGVSITSVSRSELDQKLNSGPVIAGLYGGPDHFIVILKKEGSSYIMHDPFLENGNNKNLTDKYSVSDITSLRSVQFN